MKVIKVSALWCGACLGVIKTWNRLKEEYDFEAVELDYDLDEEEVKSYSTGTRIPAFLFIKDGKEVGRLIGEVSYEELEKKFLEVGGTK